MLNGFDGARKATYEADGPNIGSFQELADDLSIKRETGEITEQEWGTHEIGNEVFALQPRTLQELKMTRDPRNRSETGR